VSATGYDLEADAVRAAEANAARAGTAVRFSVADATALPLAEGAASRVVTNPPWGETVAATGGLRQGRAALWFELARVLEPGGELVALVPASAEADEELRAAGFATEVVTSVRVGGTEALVLSAQRTA